MEYYDQEYLNLFKKVQEQKIETKTFGFEQLRESTNNVNLNQYRLNETPDYSSFQNFRQNNLNEVQRNNYSQDYNLNEFNIETRINGQNINEIREIRREERENRLNEVMKHIREQQSQELKKNENLNENINFKDTDVVTLEMFDKARYNSMVSIARRINPK